MLLLLAAVLPSVLWDAPPDTAPVLREAGITHISVPAARIEEWRVATGISVTAARLDGAVKLDAPSVDYRINRGGATSAPWLNSNGWTILRQPHARFLYDVKGPQAALAAAEAFTFGAEAMVRTDAAGLKPLAAMLEFLHSLPEADLPPISDIGFVDDGTDVAGEVMNMMIRDNLLFRIVGPSDRSEKVTVRLGSPEYPAADAQDPTWAAHEVRARLTDDRRSIRVYGSQVVVARLYGSGGRVRVALLNYAGAERKVNGIRVRVQGEFSHHKLAVAGGPQAELTDYSADAGATEFTLPELKTYAVIDLQR
jgi:hypothetical protein